jgi:hypothetical protein
MQHSNFHGKNVPLGEREHQGSSDIMLGCSITAADKGLAGRAAGEEIYPTAILFLEEGRDKKMQIIAIVR